MGAAPIMKIEMLLHSTDRRITVKREHSEPQPPGFPGHFATFERDGEEARPGGVGGMSLGPD